MRNDNNMNNRMTKFWSYNYVTAAAGIVFKAYQNLTHRHSIKYNADLAAKACFTLDHTF